MRSLGFYIAAAMILLASVCSLAQSAPDAENGFKNYGSYHGTNLDTVNVTNGNWMLHAPALPDAVQRGSLTDHLMMYSTSKNWQPSCTFPSTGPVCQWSIGPVPSLGANSFGGVLLERGFDLRLTRTVIKTNDGSGNLSWGINGYALRTADMATHQLYPISVDGNSDPAAMETIDTSGYHVVMSNADLNGIENTVTLTDRQGRQYVGHFDAYSSCTVPNIAPIPSVGGRSPVQMAAPFGDQYCTQVAWLWQVTDANGNQMSFHGPQNSNAGVDTLGRGQPLESGASTSDTSGCVSSLTINGVYLMAYNAPNGTQQQLKLCYATLPLATAFNQTAYGVQIKEAPNSVSAVQVLVTAILADGSKWVFNYDSYGEITSVELPAGGSISLTWTTVSQSGGCSGLAQVSRAVATRTLNDNNGHSYLWTYQWGTPANNSLTNVVTDPLGNDTVHGFTALTGCRFYETSTQNYQGRQSGGQLLQEVDTVYSSSVLNDNSGTDLGNVVPVSIKTTVYPSGKVKLVTKSYDAGLGANAPIFGNLVTEKEYDWGQGAAGALLRETDTTYQWQVNSAYLTAHLLDLPSSVVVKDGNGNRVAETDYTYDESAYLTPSNITTQHGAAPNTVRGNLTTVSKWLNTSSSPVVSHSNWYDTGEVYQAIDPLGNTTTHSYDPAYVGGYSTRTCNALSQCVSGTYDFNTGLLTSFTDANGSYAASGNTPGDPAHTSNYGYDLMSRLTTAQLPADPAGNHPHTTLTYSPANSFPLSVQRSRSITSSMNDVATNYFDGLGRVYQGQHSTPNGNVTVLTTYDGLDHAVQVTNPYFSTSDPTYGVIQTQYDALGRATQVTKQDGSVSSVAYDTVPIQAVAGDCTRTTDEAGKQRLTCADGLGRLTEVHEPGDSFNGSQAQGSFSVGGNLQTYTIPGTNSTPGKGSVTINGGEQSVTTSNRYCAQYDENGDCVDWEFDNSTISDSGKVTITVNGHSDSYNFGSGDTTATIATALANAINGDGGAYVTASASGATVNLTSKANGSVTNYSLASSYTWDSTDFSSPSFTTSNSGGALTGGANGTNPSTVYDSGTVTVTIGSFTASAPYSQGGNSTAGQVAQALISSSNPNNLNRSGSPVTASVSGSTLTITYSSVGTAGNVSVSCGSSTSQGTYFSSPSFGCPGTTALNGGYNPEAPSLDFNYFVTQYGYDALGNLLNVTQKGDPTVTSSSQYRVRSFTYDSLSRLLTATNPESGQISYSYDADGNMLQKTSPAPNQAGSATQTISYCYDKLNRVTGKAYSAQTCTNGQLPSGTAVVTYTYDAGANGIGHLTSLTDQAGSGSYSFDALGRIGSESRTIAGIQKSLAYTYNLDNSVATLKYPSGAVVTYTPDAAGRILSAIDSGSNINYITGATYGPDSALTGFVSGNSSSFAGITNTFSYNTRLQPCRLSATTGAPPASCMDGTNIGNVIDLSYDFHLGSGDNGNVFRLVNNKDLSRIQTFTYDALNRLTSAQNAGTDCSQTTLNGKTKYWGNTYGYDAWGNLLQKTVTKCSAENLSVTALANNQLSGYSYDAAGNMTHDATTSLNYSFDQENRITGAAGYTYSYDADGNRVEKSNGSTGTIYWYMSPGIVAESDLTGTLTSEYVFFDGKRVARKDFPGGAVSYYFSDELKTADLITDSAGNIKSESDYYPFGGELSLLNGDSNHYKHNGKERDAETGLDYYGARYYSSPLSRFLTPDWSSVPVPVPYADLHNPQTLNQYTFAHNNPTSLDDPDGHDPPGDDTARNAVVAGAPIIINPFDVMDGLADAGKAFWHFMTSGPPPHIPGSPLPPPACGCNVPDNQNNNNSKENNNNSKSQNTSGEQSGSSQGQGKSGTQDQQAGETEGNDLGRSSTTKQSGAQGQNTETTVTDPAGSTTYKTTPGKTGGQSTIVVRKDANGNTVYVKQEARTNNRDFNKAPDHVHYKRPSDKEVK